MDRNSLTDLRSSVVADIAGLAAPSFRHSRQGDRPSGPSAPAPSGSTDVHVTVNLSGGVIFLDDERRMRLLAREIKRLIIEDVRRGIGV